jgi:galactokinase
MQIPFDPASIGTALCVINTGGNHADLIGDYAAIPIEMKAVAAVFGKTVLRELDYETILSSASKIREVAGDRALLRALHFFNENSRVDAMFSALEDMNNSSLQEDKQKALGVFLEQVNKSGDSSWELLQNVYPPHNPKEQGVSLALAFTRDFLSANCENQGACRVHGGGFAGTIQAYIPMAVLSEYQKYMENFFGSGSVTVLNIRPVGAVELEF